MINIRIVKAVVKCHLYIFCLFFMCWHTAIAQQSKEIVLVGSVSNAKKEVISGVLVELVGSNERNITDNRGQYFIKVIPTESVLRFSHPSYLSKEVRVSSKSILNVSLVEENSPKNEVIDLGFYTDRRSDILGAVSIAEIQSIEKAPVIRFEEALAGRMAGLSVNSLHGQPGDPLNIVIRGNSILNQSQPLYIVDKVVVENINDLILNKDEIRSIVVLKDASELALYGSRGANGVILIETKRGKNGKSNIQFNTLLGFQKSNKKMAMLSPIEYIKYQLELNDYEARRIYLPSTLQETDPNYINNGPSLSDYGTSKFPSLDWQEEVFRISPVNSNSISIDGGDSNTKFIISTAIQSQQGVLLNSGLKKYMGRAFLDQRISNKLNVGLGINYGENNRYGQALNFEQSVNRSTYSLFRTWGARPISGYENISLLDYLLDPNYNSGTNVKYNPVISLENEDKRRKNSNFISQAFIDVDILPNLKGRVQGSILLDNIKGTSFYNSLTPAGTGSLGVNGDFYMQKNKYVSSDAILRYSSFFNRVHTVNMLLGFSYQDIASERYGFAGVNLPNEDIGIYGFDEGLPVSTTSLAWDDNYKSYFFRGEYNYKSKYYFAFALRADEIKDSERLGFSPAVSAAWNMKDDFFKFFPSISEAKFRMSFGRSGDRLRFDSEDIGYRFHDDFRWTAVNQFDIGYNLGLFKDRISLTFDYYKKRTHNARVYSGIGRVNNEGFEVALTTHNISNKKIKWRTDINLSFVKNKIVKLNPDRGGNQVLSSMFEFVNPIYSTNVGNSISSFYGYTFDGVYQLSDFDYDGANYVLKSNIADNGNSRVSIQPGDIKYKDLNSDLHIDENDQRVLGNSLPTHYGGFNNSIIYKSFDFNIFFQWSSGNKIFNANRLVFEGDIMQKMGMNQFATYQDRWTIDNPSNTLYRVGGQGPADYISNRVLEDGSYLRLKTVALGYTLPKEIVKNVYLKNLRLFVSAQNLLTFTKYSGLDPEVSVRHSVLTQGFDYSAYPQARTVAFGLNAIF